MLNIMANMVIMVIEMKNLRDCQISNLRFYKDLWKGIDLAHNPEVAGSNPAPASPNLR